MNSLRFALRGVTVTLLAGWGPACAITDIETALHPGYDVMTLRPTDFKPMVGGLEFLPDGRLLVLTWRGNLGPEKPLMDPYSAYGALYAVSGAGQSDPSALKVAKIADGFKDAFGVLYVQGSIYVGDIDRLIKLEDQDGDGYYETKRTFAQLPAYNGWFEFAFGPVFKDGRFYMALAAPVMPGGAPQIAKGPGRSTVLSIDMEGRVTPIAGGLRAPDGIAIGPGGDLFVTDNQGVWEPSSKLIHVRPGRQYGYRIEPADAFSSQPQSPPAVWLPYGVINNSATEPALMPVGRYQGQFFFGDIKRGGIRRIFLEKVAGNWQGAVFPFTGGTEAGIHRIRIDSAGTLYAGGLGRDVWENWNGKTYGLQKFTPNGGSVFEMLAVRARKNGMEIEFTQPVGEGAEKASFYRVRASVMKPGPGYGAGSMADTREIAIKSVRLSPDRLRVYLELGGLTADSLGTVVHVVVSGPASQAGKPLWFNETWYTLNAFSEAAPFQPDSIAAAGRALRPAGPAPAIMARGPGCYLIRAPGREGAAFRIVDSRGAVEYRGTLGGSGEYMADFAQLATGVYCVVLERGGRVTDVLRLLHSMPPNGSGR